MYEHYPISPLRSKIFYEVKNLSDGCLVINYCDIQPFWFFVKIKKIRDSLIKIYDCR